MSDAPSWSLLYQDEVILRKALEAWKARSMPGQQLDRKFGSSLKVLQPIRSSVREDEWTLTRLWISLAAKLSYKW